MPTQSDDEIEFISANIDVTGAKHVNASNSESATKKQMKSKRSITSGSGSKNEKRSVAAENEILKRAILRLQRKHKIAKDSLGSATANLAKKTDEFNKLHGMQGDRFAQGIEHIKETLKCGICLSTMQDPTIVIDCGHSFCKTCIKAVLDVPDFVVVDFYKVARDLQELVKKIDEDPSIITSENIIKILQPSNYLDPPNRCPVCRKGVYHEVIANYSLISIIAAITETNSSTDNPGDAIRPTTTETVELGAFVHQALFVDD